MCHTFHIEHECGHTISNSPLKCGWGFDRPGMPCPKKSEETMSGGQSKCPECQKLEPKSLSGYQAAVTDEYIKRVREQQEKSRELENRAQEAKRQKSKGKEKGVEESGNEAAANNANQEFRPEASRNRSASWWARRGDTATASASHTSPNVPVRRDKIRNRYERCGHVAKQMLLTWIREPRKAEWDETLEKGLCPGCALAAPETLAAALGSSWELDPWGELPRCWDVRRGREVSVAPNGRVEGEDLTNPSRKLSNPAAGGEEGGRARSKSEAMPIPPGKGSGLKRLEKEERRRMKGKRVEEGGGWELEAPETELEGSGAGAVVEGFMGAMEEEEEELDNGGGYLLPAIAYSGPVEEDKDPLDREALLTEAQRQELRIPPGVKFSVRSLRALRDNK